MPVAGAICAWFDHECGCCEEEDGGGRQDEVEII